MVDRTARSTADALVILWALAGVGATLSIAVVRLSGRGWATVSAGLTPSQWLVLAATAFAFVYGEGVLALERRWIPRVVRRAQTLPGEQSVLLRFGAPLYAMGLIGAPIRRVGRAWLGVSAIVLAVVVVRSFSEPWRGIVDLSVAGALTWGTITIVRSLPGAIRGRSSGS